MLNLQLSWHYSTPAWSCPWQLHPLNSSFSHHMVGLWTPGIWKLCQNVGLLDPMVRETNTKRNAGQIKWPQIVSSIVGQNQIVGTLYPSISAYPYSIPIRISSSYHQKKSWPMISSLSFPGLMFDHKMVVSSFLLVDPSPTLGTLGIPGDSAGVHVLALFTHLGHWGGNTFRTLPAGLGIPWGIGTTMLGVKLPNSQGLLIWGWHWVPKTTEKERTVQSKINDQFFAEIVWNMYIYIL